MDLEYYPKDYEEYVKPLIAYYSGDISGLRGILQVEEIIKKGEYIMGIFGGEEKKGKQTYAGLTITNFVFDKLRNEYYIMLYRMSNFIRVPLNILKQYRINVYKLIYRGCIHPFNLTCVYNILLSESGKDELKQFLNEILTLNDNILSRDDKTKIEKLREEVIQPDSIRTLSQNKCYVLYRGKRTFSATLFIPKDSTYILDSSMATLNCGADLDKCLFYSAALNYLAYKIIKLRRAFVRDQYARPIYALIDAGLVWGDFAKTEPSILQRIIDLSSSLHAIVPQIFSKKSYVLEREAFKDLENIKEFKELVALFDKYIEKHVGEECLKEALSWVSG